MRPQAIYCLQHGVLYGAASAMAASGTTYVAIRGVQRFQWFAHSRDAFRGLPMGFGIFAAAFGVKAGVAAALRAIESSNPESQSETSSSEALEVQVVRSRPLALRPPDPATFIPGAKTKVAGSGMKVAGFAKQAHGNSIDDAVS